MIRSMTSFGRCQSEEGRKYLFSIEMKSVNNRYLDINIKSPKFIISLEDKIRRIINSSISRGKVDLFINYKCYDNSNVMPKIDVNLAKRYYDCYEEVAKALQIDNDITVSKITSMPDVLSLEIAEHNLDEITEELLPLIQDATSKMVEMREREGEKLKEDILLKLQEINNKVNSIMESSKFAPQEYKRKLEDRLSELTKGMTIDEERIAVEVAIFADKVSIDEEITRLFSHIYQMRKTLELQEPIGRKLDFIVQEMNREVNTIGSKANDMEITNIVINIKNLIEKIREQVQNIE